MASAVLAANLELFREQLLDPHVGNSQPLQLFPAVVLDLRESQIEIRFLLHLFPLGVIALLVEVFLG